MSSSIIGDAKYQELNMSFTFDEQEEGKMTVNAVADQIPYKLELFANPDLDFEDLKNILLSKQFKLVSKTPEILKIKIAFTFFEFKNVEKMTLNILKQTITELSSKLKEKSHKIVVLEEVVKQLRKDVDSMTTGMADLKRENDENKHQMIEAQKMYQEQVTEIDDLKTKVNTYESELDLVRSDVKQKHDNQERENNDLKTKINTYENELGLVKSNVKQKHDNQERENNDLKGKIGKHQNELESLRSQAEKEKRQKESQGKKVNVLETDLRKCEERINLLEKASTESLKKLERDVNDQREKQKIHNNQLEESIRTVFSKVQQIEKIEFIQKYFQQIEQKKKMEMEMKIAKQNSEYLFSSQHKKQQFVHSQQFNHSLQQQLQGHQSQQRTGWQKHGVG